MNKHRGELQIVAGEDTFIAKLPINSLCALEAVADAPATEVIGKLVDGMGHGHVNFRLLRALLWAMLIAKHPSTTLEEAGNIIEVASVEYIMKKVVEIIPITFPEMAKALSEAEAKNPEQ